MVDRIKYPGDVDPNFTVVSGSGVERDPWKGIYFRAYPNINGVTQFPFLESPINDERVYRITQIRVHWNGAVGVTISPCSPTMQTISGVGNTQTGWAPYTTTAVLFGDNYVWDTPWTFVAKTGVHGGMAAAWTATNTPLILHLGAGAGLNDDLALYVEADIWFPQPLDTTPAGMTPVSLEGYKWPLQRR